MNWLKNISIRGCRLFIGRVSIMRDPIVGPQWKLLDTGETFTWISNEHCMLLVGYDEDSYYF